MHRLAHLSLGSNLGDRDRYLGEATRRLRSVGRVQAISSLYETQPVELTAQPWFLNCALALETSASPAGLMEQLLAIESAMGRQRIQKKGPRNIDLDIVLFADLVVNTPGLRIPHPAMQERRFVLAPLAEIAPSVIHPVFNKTIQELLEELPPGQIVKRLKRKLAPDPTNIHRSRLRRERG
jgi:2-amino-4-hydroxy-6-hydroxymethyldihydropteridine diphosphokinase